MRTQLKILLLLIDVLVVLAIYAMSPVEWAIANNELRKVKFLPAADSTAVAAQTETDGEAQGDDAEQATVAALATTPQPKVKDTNPQRFLFFFNPANALVSP